MSQEAGVGEALADQVIGGRRSVDVAALTVCLHLAGLEGKDSVSEVALGNFLNGSRNSNGSGPDEVSFGWSSSLEGSRNSQPAELDSAPGGLVVDGSIVVEVEHGEVHQSVLVAEYDLIDDQAVELLVGGTLETSDGEGVKDFSVGAEVELAEGH